jgi:hypothetical protein
LILSVRMSTPIPRNNNLGRELLVEMMVGPTKLG